MQKYILIYELNGMQFDHELNQKAVDSIIDQYKSVENWLRSLVTNPKNIQLKKVETKPIPEGLSMYQYCKLEGTL